MLKARKGWKCVSSYFDSLLFFYTLLFLFPSVAGWWLSVDNGLM